jgi:hypothetical protein
MKEGGHRVILCTAEPSWVQTKKEGQKAYQNLEYFEKETIRKFHNTLALTLAGDFHHYCRYQEKEGSTHKITAGGGGAYLFGTHHLPDELALHEKSIDATATAFDRQFEDGGSQKIYERKATFPAISTSRWLAFGVLLFPFKNFTFSLALGFFYLIFAWIVQSASGPTGLTFMGQVQSFVPDLSKLFEVCYILCRNLKYSPAGVIFAVFIVAGLAAFCGSPKSHVKLIWGSMHGLIHVVLSIVLIWFFAYLNLTLMGMNVDNLGHTLFFSLEMLLVGSFAGGLVMAIYLLFSDFLFRLNTNEVFSAQRLANYKNFLRLHVDKNGKLTVYPVGVTKISGRKNWRLNTNAAEGQSWFEPKKEDELKPHLIEEEPICIP